jgi:hypothetical protein
MVVISPMLCRNGRNVKDLVPGNGESKDFNTEGTENTEKRQKRGKKRNKG